MKAKFPYKRVLLKLSGEALQGAEPFGIDPIFLQTIVSGIQNSLTLGIQLGIVIGAGNLFRGKKLAAAGMDRVTSDQMGMIGTMMNSLALYESLQRTGISTKLMSAIPVNGILSKYNKNDAIAALNANQVVIFAAGTGNPCFTTDSAACLRAIEVAADIVLKATKVDGVYDTDPCKDPQATRYQRLTYQQVLSQELQVMDLAAFILARDYNLPIKVFNINKLGMLEKILTSTEVGTLITTE